jgi:hypothetical protein
VLVADIVSYCKHSVADCVDDLFMSTTESMAVTFIHLGDLRPS